MIDFFKAKILNTKIIEENLIGNGLLHYKAKYDSEKNKKLEHPKIIEDWLNNDKGLYQVDSSYKPTKKQKKHQILIKIENFFGVNFSKKHYKLV